MFNEGPTHILIKLRGSTTTLTTPSPVPTWPYQPITNATCPASATKAGRNTDRTGGNGRRCCSEQPPDSHFLFQASCLQNGIISLS